MVGPPDIENSTLCRHWRLQRILGSSETVYGPTHQIQSSLRTSNGQGLLIDKKYILNHWSEHFPETLFSENRTVQDPAILCIPQLPIKEELKSGKAAGVDGIEKI